MTPRNAVVHLAVNPPVLPMLAKPAHALPDGEGWLFEPKWDGFRALVFRDADELFIQSRDEKRLGRYYPELIEPLRMQLPRRCGLDGEIVIVRSGGLDFEALQLRLHPAESRVRLLAKEMPASVIFFDILCEGDRDLRSTPFEERRAILARLLARAQPPLRLTPSTCDRTVAADWFRRFEGAGLDGVMAKQAIGVYESNKRTEYTEGRWTAAAAGDRRSGGQDRPGCHRHGAECDLRGEFPRVLIRVSTGTGTARRARRPDGRDHQPQGELDIGRRHPIVLGHGEPRVADPFRRAS